jgi:hypothetical protein
MLNGMIDDKINWNSKCNANFSPTYYGMMVATIQKK